MPVLKKTLNRRTTLAGLLSSVLAPSLSWAQSDKNIRLILPVSAGSGVDGIVRASSTAIGKALGSTIVIENLPGAGGLVGTQALVRAAPDGLTLGVVSNNHVVFPSVLKGLSFDPVEDITPIAVLGATPFVLVCNAKLPVTNLKEFTALLKANPGKYNFASSGNGTILHLAAEIYKDTAQTFSTHIPYRGFAPMLQDIVGGQVHWGVAALPAVFGQIKAGNLKALCIPSTTRSAAAPDIPTSTEAGLPAFIVEGWFAAVAPKNLPADQLKRVHAALTAAFATAEVKEAMAKQGNNINISTPEFATDFFNKELKRYAVIVKKAGVVAQ